MYCYSLSWVPLFSDSLPSLGFEEDVPLDTSELLDEFSEDEFSEDSEELLPSELSEDVADDGEDSGTDGVGLDSDGLDTVGLDGVAGLSVSVG